MKRLLVILGVLALIFVGAVVAAVLLIDAESFREPIRQYASDALGRDVKLGKLDLTLFPLPAVRADGIEIAGHQKDAKPFAQVEALSLRVAVLPLLARRLVLRSVELQSPRIHVPFDRNGDPILPGQEPGAKKPAKQPGAAPSGEASGATKADAPAEPTLAIDRITIRNAEVVAGPYKLSGADLDGAFTLGGSANFDLSIADVDYSDGDVSLKGPVRGSLALGDSFSLDLDDATIRSGEAFRKPAGERLRISGPFGNEFSAASIGDVALQLGSNQISLSLGLAEPRTRIGIRPTSLDLGALVPFLSPDTPKLDGNVEVETMTVKLDPLALDGRAKLDAVSVPLDNGPIVISGPLVAKGQTITLADATAQAGETPVAVSGSYDLQRGVARFEFDTEETQVQPLMKFLAGRSELSGLLLAGGKFQMSEGIQSLNGTGSFKIHPGKIQGFSLARQVLGPLAQVALLAGQLKGKDLSRYEEETFERLSADYRIDDGVLRTDNLVLAYEHATANLRGSVNLDDLALDMRGEVVLSKELDGELAGAQTAKRRVIPLANVRGTALSPRIVIDQQTLTSVAAAYLGQDRVQKKLQEKLDGDLGEKIDKALGPGGREAVKGILGGLFGAPPAQQETAPAQTAPAETAPAEPAATEPPTAEPPATEAPAAEGANP